LLASCGPTRARMASEAAMPASAPPLASNPAQNALPMTALTPGTNGSRNPIRMHARQVRTRKTDFAATLTAPRLAAAVRKLAYQRSAKTAIDAAIRMDGLLFLALTSHRLADEWMAPARAIGADARLPSNVGPGQAGGALAAVSLS
jgi:hypothetical protein